MSFSDRLRQARKRQGLTQEELGKKSGLSTYTIQRYEYGKLNPKKDTVAKLAAALNLGYNYTKSGEPYFYTFADTVPSREYEGVEDFNQEQCRNFGINFVHINHCGTPFSYRSNSANALPSAA